MSSTSRCGLVGGVPWVEGTRMLEVGRPAPDFEVSDHEGRTVQLRELRGRKVLLWFYPKADTPG